MNSVMSGETVAQLLDLNRTFYGDFSASFAQSRAKPWAGFAQLKAALPVNYQSVLDVGCGEGRLGRYLAPAEYTGVDFSAELLEFAAQNYAATYHERDLAQAGCLAGLGQFDGVCCLATMQHIPSEQNRVRLLSEMAEHLTSSGRLVIANWQFMSSERQQRKVVDWAKAGISAESVEPNDYLLTWQRNGLGYRYVTLIDEAATERLAALSNLTIESQFRADGKEGNLNLYTVLTQ